MKETSNIKPSWLLQQHQVGNQQKPEVMIKKETSFDKKYKLMEELGKGMFGTVQKCHCNETGQLFAAKIVRKTSKSKTEVIREVSNMNQLQHESIVQIHDAFETSRQMIIIMELVNGKELFEKVVQEDNLLTETQCVYYLKQILCGVQYMHNKKIVHLDLKPENILCIDSSKGGLDQIKLIDFGLARDLSSNNQLSCICGTPEFVAPEVINFDPISVQSDMWSLGVIAYVLMSGISPFLGDDDGETLQNVTAGEFDFEDEDGCFDKISEDAKEFISELLCLKPKDRLTVEECLTHPWLSTQTAEGLIDTTNLKRFIARRRWMRTIHAIKAVGRFTAAASMFGGTAKAKKPSLASTMLAALKASEEKKGESLANGDVSDDISSDQSNAPLDTTDQSKQVIGQVNQSNSVELKNSQPVQENEKSVFEQDDMSDELKKRAALRRRKRYQDEDEDFDIFANIGTPNDDVNNNEIVTLATGIDKAPIVTEISESPIEEGKPVSESKDSKVDVELSEKNSVSNDHDVKTVSDENGDDSEIVSDNNDDDAEIVSDNNDDDVETVGDKIEDNVEIVDDENGDDVEIVSDENSDNVEIVGNENDDDVEIISDENGDSIEIVSDENGDDTNKVHDKAHVLNNDTETIAMNTECDKSDINKENNINVNVQSNASEMTKHEEDSAENEDPNEDDQGETESSTSVDASKTITVEAENEVPEDDNEVQNENNQDETESSTSVDASKIITVEAENEVPEDDNEVQNETEMIDKNDDENERTVINEYGKSGDIETNISSPLSSSSSEENNFDAKEETAVSVSTGRELTNQEPSIAVLENSSKTGVLETSSKPAKVLPKATPKPSKVQPKTRPKLPKALIGAQTSLKTSKDLNHTTPKPVKEVPRGNESHNLQPATTEMESPKVQSKPQSSFNRNKLSSKSPALFRKFEQKAHDENKSPKIGNRSFLRSNGSVSSKAKGIFGGSSGHKKETNSNADNQTKENLKEHNKQEAAPTKHEECNKPVHQQMELPVKKTPPPTTPKPSRKSLTNCDLITSPKRTSGKHNEDDNNNNTRETLNTNNGCKPSKGYGRMDTNEVNGSATEDEKILSASDEIFKNITGLNASDKEDGKSHIDNSDLSQIIIDQNNNEIQNKNKTTPQRNLLQKSNTVDHHSNASKTNMAPSQKDKKGLFMKWENRVGSPQLTRTSRIGKSDQVIASQKHSLVAARRASFNKEADQERSTDSDSLSPDSKPSPFTRNSNARFSLNENNMSTTRKRLVNKPAISLLKDGSVKNRMAIFAKFQKE